MTEYIITGEQLERLGIPDMFTEQEIIRCRDCRFASEAYWPENSGIPSDYLDCHGELVETWDYYWDEPKDNPVRPDGFCAWGEKQEA